MTEQFDLCTLVKCIEGFIPLNVLDPFWIDDSLIEVSRKRCNKVFANCRFDACCDRFRSTEHEGPGDCSSDVLRFDDIAGHTRVVPAARASFETINSLVMILRLSQRNPSVNSSHTQEPY